MCLAIANPKGNIIPLEHLQNGFEANSDGAGFATVHKGKVIIEKGFMDFKAFYEAYKVHEGKPAIVHFRWATHGDKNEFNCHPWEVIPNELAVVHNGIIQVQSTKEMSDTGHFVEFVLKPILERAPEQLYCKAFTSLVRLAIGTTNKLCFLTWEKDIVIINEKSGTWEKGVWYSNDGYKEAPKYAGYNWAPMKYQKGTKAYTPKDFDIMEEQAWKDYETETANSEDVAVNDSDAIQDVPEDKPESLWRDMAREEVAYWRARGHSKREAKRIVFGR